MDTILIRLPNWLGDMVMSTAFIKAVQHQFPHAAVDIIVKKGFEFLLEYFPKTNAHYIFDKEKYKGLGGAYRFGKYIKQHKKYDLFFCLPDSISSAAMGYATGAALRVGYKKELRPLLLTHSYTKKKGIHRVQEYVDLLQQFTKISIPIPGVQLIAKSREKNNALIININSEASSRRLPAEKAISLINGVRKKTDISIKLIGSPKETAFVNEVYHSLDDKDNIENLAGKITLPQLVDILSTSTALLTTDSGPAHIANAAGIPAIVLFGAGNEDNTAPYNSTKREIIRLGKLPCEKCVSNTCKKYSLPKCLTDLDNELIISTVKKYV